MPSVAQQPSAAARPRRPQLAFLVRATVLLVVSLALWWMFLVDPLLTWTRLSGRVVLSLVPGAASGQKVTVRPDDIWLLQLPVPAEAQNRADLQQLAGGAQPHRVRSFKMTTSRGQVALYTVAVPIFLALMFCVGMPVKEFLRSLAIGCGILLLLMPIDLAIYGMTTIRDYFHIQPSPAVGFLWSAAGYMNSEVFPYLVPLFLALWLNRPMRQQIFSWVPAGVSRETPAAEQAKPQKKKRRR